MSSDAAEIRGGRTDIRPSDDAPEAIFGAHAKLAGDFAATIEFLEARDFFVSRDLQDAVGRSVHDEGIVAHLLFAKPDKDFCSARGAIPDDLVAGPFL